MLHDRDSARFDEAFQSSLADLIQWRRDVRRFRSDPVDDSVIHALVRLAALSPSVGNSQPWRFRVTPAGVDVYADRSRILGVVDPAGRELLMSVGAAIFNLRTGMLAHGRQRVLRLLPEGPAADLVARVTPGPFVHASETVWTGSFLLPPPEVS